MINNYFKVLSVLLFGSALLVTACGGVTNSIDVAATNPNDRVQISEPSASPVSKKPENIAGAQTVVFAGGCFWGVEAVFEHVKGVSSATSGYSGGKAETADYETVSSGTTGHAESVQVIYDPAVISYEQLLKVFFSIVHDPTELNRQGPDSGTQYRSAIFYTTPEQKAATEKYIAELTQAKTFSKPIVTEVTGLTAFYPAEDYHQDYLANHPNQPYIVINDQPKVDNLRKQFADIYVTK